MEGLTRGVGTFIVGNLVVGLDAFSGTCSENLPKAVAIIPVATFYSLATSFASLVILAYLANGASHLLAAIALERKRLENISELLGKSKLQPILGQHTWCCKIANCVLCICVSRFRLEIF